MAEYLKKNRKQLGWFFLPMVAMASLAFVALSVFPGWVKPAWSTLGASCVGQSTDSSSPTLLACDPCNFEFCGFNSTCTLDLTSFGDVPQCQCLTTISSFISSNTTQFSVSST